MDLLCPLIIGVVITVMSVVIAGEAVIRLLRALPAIIEATGAWWLRTWREFRGTE